MTLLKVTSASQA